VPVWTAYSRNRGKVVAHVIGTSRERAAELYLATKRAVGEISRIYTDGNSCYSEVFAEIGISKLHRIEPGKPPTHLIESVNSSIRDNLARFNRKSKRYSKRLDMLSDTLLLFFHYKQFAINITRAMPPRRGGAKRRVHKLKTLVRKLRTFIRKLKSFVRKSRI